MTIEDLKRKILDAIDKMDTILKPGWEKFLDPSFIPPNPKHRESEIQEMSIRIIDSIRNRVTRNILVYGGPGTGKTMSFKIAAKIADEALKELDVKEYKIIYTRASGTGVTQVLYDICQELNLKVPRRGISFREYLKIIEDFATKNGIYLHICVDEFDNLLRERRIYYESLLYHLTRTENVSATLITNRVDLAKEITDARVVSSLDTLNAIFFKPYAKEQVCDILSERIKLAFTDNFIDDEALEKLAAQVADEGGDIRKGLSILRFCGELAKKGELERVTGEKMAEIIRKHDTLKDGELMTSTLPLSDKIVLVALYSLIMTEGGEKVHSGTLFAKQDYYRSLMGLTGISRDSFSVYLTRLSTAGIIEIRKIGKGKRKGTESYIQPRFPLDSIAYMLNNDESLSKLREVLKEEIKEVRTKKLMDFYRSF